MLVEVPAKAVYTMPLRIDLDFYLVLKKSVATNLVSAIILKDTLQAALLVSNLNSQILLGLRKNTQIFDEHWSLPVGHVELGETNLQAIKRELKEELSIEVRDVEELFVKIDSNQSIHHRVYWVKQWQGELTNSEPQFCRQIDWFDCTKLPSLTTPISLEIIADFVRSEPFRRTLNTKSSNKD